jgi:alpha-tubulin suppressor-like RCC1 family protein
MSRAPRRSLGRLARTLIAVAAVPLLPAGCGVEEAPSEPIGAAEQAVTTCITVQRGTSGTVSDAFVRSNAATTNYGSSAALTASIDTTGMRHALVKWDVSAVPAGATVTSATASLKVTTGGGALGHAHRLTQPWSESTVTWAGYAESTPSTPVSANFSAVAAGATASADVTALVQAWVSGAYPNHGILVERDDASGANVYASSEDPTVANRPSLQICYTPPSLCANVTCTPQSQCYTASCNPQTGQCQQTPKADGTACNDGDACTQTDTCQAGACVGSNPVTCSAADQCHTAGTCNPATGACSSPAKADGTACDDGNACTQSDACQAGVCTGSNPVTCSAADQCHTAGTCNPATGACSSPAKPNGAACDDGVSSTTADYCWAGVCLGGTTSPWILAGGTMGMSVCASKDGRPKCWGNNYYGQLGLGDTNNRGDEPNEMGDNLPVIGLGAGRTVLALSSAGYFDCAILDTGAVKCWGLNSVGQLGLGDTSNRGANLASMGDDLPVVDLGTGRTAVALAAGGHHACAILDNGKVKCWGYNPYGELGLGDTNSRGDVPGETGDNLPYVNLGTGRTAVALVGGEYHTCAILDNAQLKCWGENSYGELGIGDTYPRGVSAAGMGDNLPYVNLGTGRTAVSITAGQYYTCAILDNAQLKCWGNNYSGQCGIGSNAGGNAMLGDVAGEMGDSLPAVNLGTGRTAVAVTAGIDHTCAVLDNGGVKCWGANSSGELGLGDTATRGWTSGQMGDSLPYVNLGTGRTAVAIAGRRASTCAQLDDASIKCWGAGFWGQLGNGDFQARGDNAGEMGDSLPVLDLGH